MAKSTDAFVVAVGQTNHTDAIVVRFVVAGDDHKSACIRWFRRAQGRTGAVCAQTPPRHPSGGGSAKRHHRRENPPGSRSPRVSHFRSRPSNAIDLQPSTFSPDPSTVELGPSPAPPDKQPGDATSIRLFERDTLMSKHSTRAAVRTVLILCCLWLSTCFIWAQNENETVGFSRRHT